MAEFHLTPDQESAVNARDSAVLVSAAAGSGKTRVLVERLMRRVAEGEDIDRFLIITYTRAAAGELRGRIQTELGRLSAAHPEDRRLRRQAGLCCRAPIGTIHSFCTSLLRENAQALSLVPNFRVADENRALAIRTSVLERLMDRLYTELDVRPGLRSLIDTVGAGRDDSRLTALVLELHTVLRSHPWPARWAAEQLRAMDVRSITDAGETPWGREILDNAAENALYWAERMEDALHKMSSPENERLFTAYGSSFSDSAAGLRALARESARGWDAACACLPIPFPNLKAFRGEDALKDEVTALRNTVKKAAADLLKQLEGPSERHLRELDEMRPAMSALLSLAVELDTAFSAEKRRQGLLDFSDLEHLSLRLLEDPETGARTPLAEAVSRRYCEIMVDEYQDVSEIQDRLFRAVSREDPENLFFVGDVKQSIYRFRLAEPGIFLRKLHSWADADAPKGTPRRILLRENFRSRGSVLAAANHVFSALMSPRLGELRYDEEASLRQGAVYPPEGEVPALLSVLSLPRSGDTDEDSPEECDLEPTMVARQIRKLVENRELIAPDGKPRPIGFGDIVILLNSPRSSGEYYRHTLLREGIPVASGQDTGFFQSQEASVLLSLLTVIDNPRQDVPLISVLRSPVFGFTPDDLASVRSSASTGDFYSALTLRAAENDALGIRSARFLEQLENWRELAPDLGVEGLTAHMTEELHLDTLCAALPDGEIRRENLQRFTELTRLYEADGWRGLYGFGTWLRRLAERGEEQAATAPPADNAVRILSIHKSKGLEFPVVFLADTARRFNRNDERRTVLVHQNLGLGPKITDLQRGIEYPGLARRAIAARIARESLSESLRVLYVAMTRARERIYISCAWRKPERVLEKLSDGLTNPVAPQLLETDLSPAHWLVRAALLDGSPIGLQICEPSDMFAGSDATDSISGTEPEPYTFNEQDNAVYEALCQRLNWVYPCAQAETMPSKITATSYKLPLPPDEDAAVLDAPPRRPVRRPELLQKRGLTAAERGTATHLTLQLMDFSRTDSAESIRKEAERLAALGNLTAEQLEAVDVRALLRFFRSETGRRILNADRVRREFRFSLLCPANTLTPGCDTDEVLLQGVVDCCFEENNELTVVDYKTDYVPPEGPAALVKRYTPQVQIYLTALSRVLGLPVREGILYFLRSGDAVSVPPDRKM